MRKRKRERRRERTKREMNKIYITDSQNKVEVTRALAGLVRRAVGQALKYERVPFSAELSVTFVDNADIKKLNAEYRNIDRETDVLSFPLYESGEIAMSDGKRAALGDIVISLEKAVAQAKEYGHSLEREVAFLTVHSVLHLLGYDHETGEEDEREMFALQEEILEKMKLSRAENT